MSDEKVIMTEEGHKKMMAELKYLKTVKRKEVTEALATARAHGDLKENAEYDAAKDAKKHLETQIAKLELKLSNAKIVDPKELPTDAAYLGATLSLENLNSGDKITYILAAEDEADFDQGKISVKSPLGLGLLGKKIGEVAEIKVPAGLLKLKVLNITRDL